MSIVFNEKSLSSEEGLHTFGFDALALQLSVKYSPFDVANSIGTQVAQRFDATESNSEATPIAIRTTETEVALWSFVSETLKRSGNRSVWTKRRPHEMSESAYSWARRINDIIVNRDADLPSISPRIIGTARRLAFYSEERARARGVRLVPVIAPVDDGSLHIEWNRRGSVTRHLECTIVYSDDIFISLLKTLESPDGTVLRATEIRNATMHEVLAEIERLLSRTMSKL